MKDDDREHLLHVLAELSDETPDLRFGQLIANLATLARGAEVEAIWDAEDRELIAAAERLIEKQRQRKADVA
ncbi:MAG: hypothetical protein M3552_18850 [Planctomycetota bacterium]|nr:hypothetical protein [Planctomycetaceae bacterium]MDQ3332675.1 hypothetical protein [Planctomycetota bacterium]